MRQFAFLLLLLTFFIDAGFSYAQPVVPQSHAQIALSFAPLVKQVAPAVVNIYTQRKVKQHASPLFDDPFFRQFFGEGLSQGLTRERLEKALGSGVIVRSDGLVVTSRHVIADADQIRIVLSDRREFDAKIVLSDEHSDLALLKIITKDETFPYMELKDSDDAQVGDLVLAIGNPFGVGQTVTMGIISALSHQAVGSGNLDYFIQTDAAINPGNSGGALVTMDGKLTGINAAIYSWDGGNMGIGFAVPSNMVRLLINAVTEGKSSVVHPWVGLEGQEVTQSIASSLGMPQPTGFLVKSLHPASPAAKAGIHIGDVIISVNGRDVEDEQSFDYRIASLSIGSHADIGVIRKGQKQSIHVDMIAPPEEPPREETLVTGRNPIAGAKIANLSPAVSEEIGLVGEVSGVVVTSVKEGSFAAQMGMEKGDMLLMINGKKITDVATTLALLKQPSANWKLTIRRNGEEITTMIGG